MLDITEEKLSNLISTAVQAGLREHPCRFIVDTRTVDHVFGMLTDIGDGDIRRGVEVVRSHHQFTAERLTHEEEYVANHKCVTWLRSIASGVGGKLVTGFVWLCVLITAAGLLIFFGAKAAPIVKVIVNQG